MGYEKEQMIIREEQARERARQSGAVCAICGEPLTTSPERRGGLCSYHQNVMDKDD
jgi:hypothetical protein